MWLWPRVGRTGHSHIAHGGLRITEPQRQRFVELYLAAADTTGLPADAAFREALRSHVEFGSHVAVPACKGPVARVRAGGRHPHR